jgi:hypothetical protein
MDEQIDAADQTGYELLGKFEPRDAKHILKRLEEEHIAFRVDAPFEARPTPVVTLTRRHWIFIFVCPDDMKRAVAIVGEDFHV